MNCELGLLAMFYFKKFVTFLLSPLNLGLILALVGLFFLWFGKGRREREGKLLVTAGLFWICFFGLGPVAHSLMKPLEKPYLPKTKDGEISKDLQPAPEFVVVLAGGHRADPGLPLSSNLGYPAMQRLMEGIILHRRFPESKLILSGGMLSFEKKECETMNEMALALGVDPKNIILEGNSRDTRGQAEELRTVLKDRPFLLVTSANHMQRAMTLFKGQGMTPIPAPTAFSISAFQEDPDGFKFPYPGLAYLGTSHRALHEHVGTLWAKLRGQD